MLEFGNSGTLDGFKLFLPERRELTIPRGVNGFDAVGNGRMGGHEAEKRCADAVAEEHVAGLFGLGRIYMGAEAVAANFLERAREAGGVAGELDGGSVGEEFTLAADGGLNEAAKEDAEPADQKQSES